MSQQAAYQMDERKKKILQAVTDEYISTAEPVGSRSIARRYKLGISPATIRNEMADLEEEGYLEQPHTSSGRIPSDKGYRFYVDAIMQVKKPSRAQRERILSELTRKQGEIDQLIHHTARILAALTKQSTLVLSPRIRQSRVRHIELVPVSERSVLVVLVTEPGFFDTRVVELPRPATRQEVSRISYYLTERLGGLTIEDLKATLVGEIQSELSGYRSLAQEAIELLARSLDNTISEKVYREGTINMLEQPEFQDVRRVKGLLEVLEADDLMVSILGSSCPSESVQVTIGRENKYSGLHLCTIISAPYQIGGEVSGSISIVGPTRMDYSTIINLVKFAADSLSELLS